MNRLDIEDIDLKRIIDEYPTCYLHREKTAAILHDYYPNNILETNVLLDVVDSHVIQQLIKTATHNDIEKAIQVILSQHGITYDLAKWAVYKWLQALSIDAVPSMETINLDIEKVVAFSDIPEWDYCYNNPIVDRKDLLIEWDLSVFEYNGHIAFEYIFENFHIENRSMEELTVRLVRANVNGEDVGVRGETVLSPYTELSFNERSSKKTFIVDNILSLGLRDEMDEDEDGYTIYVRLILLALRKQSGMKEYFEIDYRVNL